MLSRTENRIGATCAVAGSALLFIGTYLHPMQADPNDPVAAFAEYAADRLWVASHLTQLAGVAVIVAALLLVARHLELRARTTSARLAAAGAVASLAQAAVLQAIDGIALKFMVDAWASAPPSQKETVFHAAFAIRQVEIGLASMLSLSLGLTAMVYGGALFVDGAYPKWVSALAVVGGVPTALSGIVMAYAGFSGLAMAISMPGSLVLLLWLLALGVCMWRCGTASLDEGQANSRLQRTAERRR
jgi:hypothetical protein